MHNKEIRNVWSWSDLKVSFPILVHRIADTVNLSVVQKQTRSGEAMKNVDEPTSVNVGEVKTHFALFFRTF